MDTWYLGVITLGSIAAVITVCFLAVFLQTFGQRYALLVWAGYSLKDRIRLAVKKNLPRDRILEGIRRRAAELAQEAEFLNQACRDKFLGAMGVFDGCEEALDSFILKHIDAKAETASAHNQIRRLQANALRFASQSARQRQPELYKRLSGWRKDVERWSNLSCIFLTDIFRQSSSTGSQ